MYNKNINKLQRRIEMVRTELCGKFVLEDGFCHMRRRMALNELILMTEGEMYICEDDTDFYTVREGDMLFLRAGREHRGFRESTGPVSFFWFHYSSENREDNSLASHFTPRETAYIAQLYNQLFRYCKISREAVDCAATLLVIEAREAAANAATERKITAETIRAWIEAGAMGRLTVQKIADRFGYSPDYISSILKELTGYSAKNYITHLRIDRAMELFLSTDMSAKQIAMHCGYDDYRQFLKLFKKHTGMTPKEYRQIYRHNLINTL